jgi:alanine racemase
MATQSTAENSTRAWIDIDLGALLRNGETLARHARVPLVPMVKADAYGLGAVPVARALERLDPFGFGVATVDEGRELRAAGVRRRIFVFTPLLPAELAGARDAGLTPALGSAAAVDAWAAAGGGAWHLAIDTGMSRAGVRWDAVGSLGDALRRHPPEGAFTHFHSAETDMAATALQERRFRDAVAALPAVPPLLHAENSAGIARPFGTAGSSWSLARPGVFLYGVGTGPRAAFQPESVVTMRARLVDLRDVQVGEGVSYGASWTAQRPSRVATLAVGYADGYRRSLGNRGTALVGGSRARVVGTVTMDMTMVDVTAAPCAVGDAVTLIGADGGDAITVEAVAAAADLSPYEILTGLRQRLVRRYA